MDVMENEDGCSFGKADSSKDVVSEEDGIKLGKARKLLLGIFKSFIHGKPDGCVETDGS